MFKPRPKAPNIRLFDSHCHLDFPAFDRDRDAIFEQMRKVGIEGVLIPGVTKDNWRFIRQLAAMKPGVHVALGLHPMFLKQHRKEQMFFQLLEGLHQSEAKIIIAAKDKKLHNLYKGLLLIK